MEETQFRRLHHSQFHLFLNGVFVLLLTAFPTLHNCFWWSVIASLLFCLIALTAFDFCLYFLPHFMHLPNDLHSSLTGTLSIKKWPDTAISICYFSILDYPALSICSPTILVYHGLPSAMPSACLIWPCPIYACNIISRFRLFSTYAISTCLVPLSWTADWGCLTTISFTYLLHLAAPLINFIHCIHLLCTLPCNLLIGSYCFLYTFLHLVNHWHCSSVVL